eukprot:122498-Rhodomonas_salina.1
MLCRQCLGRAGATWRSGHACRRWPTTTLTACSSAGATLAPCTDTIWCQPLSLPDATRCRGLTKRAVVPGDGGGADA